MANSNLLTDLESYRNFAMASHVYRNTSGAARFFAYIGPNGKELASGATEVVDMRASDFFGTLEKQAIARDLAAGNIRYGNNGVTLYHFRFAGGTGTAQTTAAIMPGRVVGMFVMTEAGAAGDEAITATVAGTSIVAASQTAVANSEASGKAKAVSLNTTDANLNTVPGTISVSLSNTASGDTITVVVAIAHFI